MSRTEKETAYNVHFKLPHKIVDRESFLLERCLGKRVLHIGCVDYASSGNWTESISSKRWLHKKIEKVASDLVGIDLAAEAVEMLRSRYDMRNIYATDAQHLEKLNKGRFDVIVAGEVLEHLPCPGRFLSSAHSVLKEAGSLIITTTNAFCLRRFLRIPFGKESVHIDHVAYFSHRTLQRLAEICGYYVVEQCSYRIPNKNLLLPYLVERIACLISPNLGEGIICHMRLGHK